MFAWLKKLFSSSKNELKEEVRVIDCGGEVYSEYTESDAIYELGEALCAMCVNGELRVYKVVNDYCKLATEYKPIEVKSRFQGFSKKFLNFTSPKLDKFVRIWRSRHCKCDNKLFNMWIEDYDIQEN